MFNAVIPAGFSVSGVANLADSSMSDHAPLGTSAEIGITVLTDNNETCLSSRLARLCRVLDGSPESYTALAGSEVHSLMGFRRQSSPPPGGRPTGGIYFSGRCLQAPAQDGHWRRVGSLTSALAWQTAHRTTWLLLPL